MKYCFTFLFLLTFLSTQANAFPRGCEVTGYGFNQGFVIFNPEGKQTLYLIANRTNKPIYLERFTNADDFMSPKLEANLMPGAWGAFAAELRNVPFGCYYLDSEKNKVKLNCQDSLDICQYPRAKFALSNMGTYWVSSNKDQIQVTHEAAAKGIYLKW